MHSIPILKNLVLIGGGHAHVEVLRRFAMRPLAGARLTLISSHSTSAYSGMLPGHVAGHYTDDEIQIDLRRLARAAGARFLRAEASGLDLANQQVHCHGRPPVTYDVLSLNPGSVPATGMVPGASEHAIPVKPIGLFLDHWRRLESSGHAKAIGVVGAGAAGVEIAMALHHRLCADGRPRLHLFEANPTILPAQSTQARRLVRAALIERGIEIHAGATVTRVTQAGMTLGSGESFELDAVVWTTGAVAPHWLADSGLALDDRGFVQVDRTLRSTAHRAVFAAGDIASVSGRSLPKAGVHAVRQGPPLADNLRRVLKGESPRPYSPQRHFLSLIATGGKHAVATRAGLAIRGEWVWRLKDRIDRRFMDRYASIETTMASTPPRDSLPGMKQIAEAAAMRCAGCGSKLGASVLEHALARLGGDLAIGPEDAAVLAPPPGKLLLQSVDYFPALISDPYLFGRIAANHCLGDLHATGAKPWTALALATVPSATDGKMREDLYQMLAGGQAELARAGARLVGGHSLEGSELGLGFTVNGLAEDDAVRRKSGLGPGDVLILGKALGTGVLFAGEMRGSAKPKWIDQAVETMLRSSGNAARILQNHGATAMTDVTGFGLAGHLAEMLAASNVDAVLQPDSIPVLEGALALLEAGHASSLAPRNQERLDNPLEPDDMWPASQRGLLADPQTAGGLLAGVPAERAASCLQSLHQGGDRDAAIIGAIVPRVGTRPAIRRDRKP